MQNLINNVKSSGLKVAEYFTPLLKESKFHETGVLTPEVMTYVAFSYYHGISYVFVPDSPFSTYT